MIDLHQTSTGIIILAFLCYEGVLLCYICRLILSNIAEKRVSVSGRPPAPLPRSLASLDNGFSPDSNIRTSKSDSQILDYHQTGAGMFQ